MKYRIAICTVVYAVLSASTAAAKQPNIVFFFVDDMGWQDTSVLFHTEVTELNKRYRTPNMEKLAASGIKFTQAYACSLCSPSRVSLMTGVNAVRHCVTNWTLHKNKSPDRPHPKVTPPKWNVNGLSPVAGLESTFHAVTLPMLLQKAGYRTIHAGKAHFAADGTAGEDPKALGFDVNIAGHCAGGPGSYYGKYNFSAAFRRGGRIWDVPGLEKYHGKDVYLNEVLTVEANKAVDKAVADDKPFYLYMSHYAIHAPFEADPRFVDRYKKAGLKGKAATFASMIESMDKSLGDILANIERHGITDNTVVVFMSDNGSPPGMPQNLPLRGSKLRPYEGGIRVPLLVRWPRVTKADSTISQYVMIEDIFPTFLEMAGVQEYEQVGGPIDGVSFVPLLRAEGGYPKDRPLYWHYPHTYFQAPFSAIRQGDWKLIYHHVDQRYELFNLANDLSEKRNVAADEPAIRKRLAAALGAYLAKFKAPMPIDKSTDKPVPFPGG